MTHLLEGFQQTFDVVHADNQALIEQSFALRYQVYCLEKDFEASSCFDEDKESDQYDMRSVHSLVYHRRLARYIGSVRLVLADRQAPDAPFPIENLCRNLHRARLAVAHRRASFQVAEISRFAVSKLRRAGAGNETDLTGISARPSSLAPAAKPENEILPHATLGLFTAIVRMSAANEVSHWYALMEPTLSRLLSRFGIYFQPVGPLLDHRGRRQPVMGDIDRVLARMFVERPDVWELITDAGRTWPLNESLAAQMCKPAADATLAASRPRDYSPYRLLEGVPAEGFERVFAKRIPVGAA